MEPISTSIVTALVAGATVALKETATAELKLAYQRLKEQVQKKWGAATSLSESAQEATVLLNNLEKDPEIYRPAVEKKLHQLLPANDNELATLVGLLNKQLKANTPANLQNHSGKGDQIAGNQTNNKRTITLGKGSTYIEHKG